MALTDRENRLRTIRRAGPEWMHYTVKLTPNTWELLGAELEEVVLRHPKTWLGWRKGQVDWRNLRHKPEEDPAYGDFVDSWGCVWRTTMRGISGSVVRPALASIEDIDSLRAPDPEARGHMHPIDWEALRASGTAVPATLRIGGLDHGFHLLRMEYLCGFENLMVWMLEAPDAIRRLAGTVHAYNRALLERWVATDVDMIALGEDLGTQQGSLLGPAGFSRWVAPYYRELASLVKASGKLLYLHTDGRILDIADQLLATGLDVVNPQDLLNGVEALAEAFRGRVCVDLDLDRQHAIPFGTRREIEELIEWEVKTLGSPEGGLSIKAEVRGPVPPENVDAIAGALERYATYWFEARKPGLHRQQGPSA